MTINTELTTLENTKLALKNAIIAGGGTIDNDANFADYVDALLDRFNYINNTLIEITGANNPNEGSSGSSPETVILEQIKQVLSGLGITVTNNYSDLPTIISNSYNDILMQLRELTGNTQSGE